MYYLKNNIFIFKLSALSVYQLIYCDAKDIYFLRLLNFDIPKRFSTYQERYMMSAYPKCSSEYTIGVPQSSIKRGVLSVYQLFYFDAKDIYYLRLLNFDIPKRFLDIPSKIYDVGIPEVFERIYDRSSKE